MRYDVEVLAARNVLGNMMARYHCSNWRKVRVVIRLWGDKVVSIRKTKVRRITLDESEFEPYIWCEEPADGSYTD